MNDCVYLNTEASFLPPKAPNKDNKTNDISFNEQLQPTEQLVQSQPQQLQDDSPSPQQGSNSTTELKPHLGILAKSHSRGSKPFYLSFNDIFYEIPIQNDKYNTAKKILNNISGYFKSGEVTAIMGPSGCGKTTLLNFLTSRIQYHKHSIHTGSIYLNSEEISTNIVSDYSSYVMQDDVMFDVFTPIETFKFVAKLKEKKTEKEYDSDVNDLIRILKLDKCKNTRIGNPTRKGLSGGEKKRVSIGVEIMSKPPILFLDEPTSGLDSTTSGVIIEFLKELAKVKNMIIAFTIHQPSSNIFQHFDRLLVMNKGELVYQGYAQGNNTLSNTNVNGDNHGGIVNYFDKVLNIPLKVKANPCDAFMHIIEEQNAGIEKTHIIENIHLKDKEPLTELYKTNQLQSVLKEITLIRETEGKCTIPLKNAHHSGLCIEFGVMIERSWYNYIRNPMILRIKCIMTFIYSFMVLSIFWRLKDDYQGAYDKAGFYFFFSVNVFLAIVFSAILVFPPERNIFLREYASKLYGVTSYYISKNIIETPLVLINTMFFGLFVYHGTGMRYDDAKHYFIFIAIFLLLGWLSHSLGYFFGTTFSDFNTATIITQFTVIPFFLFSGFLININNMPVWLMWLQYFSPFRFSGEAGIRNEFDDNPKSQFNVGEEYNMEIGMWKCVLIMFGWGCFLRILGGICLKLLVKKVG